MVLYSGNQSIYGVKAAKRWFCPKLFHVRQVEENEDHKKKRYGDGI